jgi:pilus assembly protein CpaC
MNYSPQPSGISFSILTLRLSAGMLALVCCFSNAQQIDAPAVAGRGVPQSTVLKMTCNGEIASPAKIELPIGKSTLLRFPQAVTNRTLGNPNVAQGMLVSPETLYLLGVSVGTTNMIVQGKDGNCSVIDISVMIDPGGLQNTFKELMPEEKDIRVTAASDSLVLSGSVSDSIAVSRAVELAQAYVRRPAVMNEGAQQEGLANTSAGAMVQQQQSNLQQQQVRVINLLTVTAAQQVMLEVKVAEVSKTLIDKLGAGVNGSSSSGLWTYSLLTSYLTGTLGGTVGMTRSNGTGIKLEAEKKDGLVKVLAEPNVMAISGQEGSFLAGGKILIPVAQSNTLGGGPTITLQEKEFGVGLRFIPTVLSGGRINLQVAPEVSELSRDGIGINNFSNTVAQIFPLITTRRASTTVQLADGQSFAIGGLIKNNTTTNIRAFPILGEIPILGALFRSSDFQNEKTELVFIVTPRLVKPLPNNYRLPTDNYRDPSRNEFFIDGKMEGAQDKGKIPRANETADGFEMK